MKDQTNYKNTIDRRVDQRRAPDEYYSVQFSVNDLAPLYQFKIRNVSSRGMCILVNEASEVLQYMHVGDIIEMTYYLSNQVGATESFRTEIRHITKDADDRFKGHYCVGLLILDKKETDHADNCV